MSVYVVTWNLNRERSNYDAARDAFIEHLERHDNIKDKLDSVRFVSCVLTATQLSDDLLTKLDRNDRLFVSRVSAGQRNGWLSNRVWEWIKSRE